MDSGVRRHIDDTIGTHGPVDLDPIAAEIVIGDLGLVQKAEASSQVIGGWVVLRRGDWSSILKESDSVDLTSHGRLCGEDTTEEELESSGLIGGIDSVTTDFEAGVIQCVRGLVNHDKVAVVDKIVVFQDPLLLELGSCVCDISSNLISTRHVRS